MAAKKALLALSSAVLIAACGPPPATPTETTEEAVATGKLGLIGVSEKAAKCAFYPTGTEDKSLAYFLGNLGNGKGAMAIDGKPLEMFGVFISDSRSLKEWRLESQDGAYVIRIDLMTDAEGAELTPQQSQNYTGSIEISKPEGGDKVDIVGTCGE